MLIKNLPVSIIIPILNEERTILHTITEISKLTAYPSEIIFVDAGSIDNTKEIISKWFEKESPSFNHIILTEHGAFPGRGRNIGIEKASYDWIAFLDSGVIPENDWLEKSYEFATTNNKNASWGTCRFEGTNGFEKILCACAQGQKRTRPYFLASSLFHKTIFHKIGYFPENLRACEDLIWIKRFRDHFGNDYICYNAIVNYYYFPSNLLAAIKKWYVYSLHTSFSRFSILHPLSYICFFISFMVLPFISMPAFIILLTAYLFFRGIISPIVKSRRFYWFQNNITSFFVAPFIILLIDLAKFTGFIVGIVNTWIFFNSKSHLLSV